MSPRVNAEFVEGAGIVIDEFEYCAARLVYKVISYLEHARRERAVSPRVEARA